MAVVGPNTVVGCMPVVCYMTVVGFTNLKKTFNIEESKMKHEEEKKCIYMYRAYKK